MLFHQTAFHRILVGPRPVPSKNDSEGSEAKAAFSNRVHRSRKTSLTVPVGPFRCLAMMSSAVLVS